MELGKKLLTIFTTWWYLVRKVCFIKNNHTATVMNEKDIKTRIRIYFRPSYDVNISGIEKFNTSMTTVKNNLLVNNVHKSWCEHLVKK